jgi:type VI secretion system protein ImpF
MQAKKNVATLFDRLTATSTTEIDNGISATQLKNYVIRDLLYLLNTTSYYYQSEGQLEKATEYANSVLNYGIEPISGRQVSEINWLTVENNIKLAIKWFEPRIMQEGLEVKCLVDQEGVAKHNQMSIEIKGLIRATPYPERFLLNTQLDVETGSFKSTT